MRGKFTLIALSMVLVAAPASASTIAGGQGDVSKASVAKEKKYCIEYEGVTGSRTSAKRECRTRAEWSKRGVNVDNPGGDRS